MKPLYLAAGEPVSISLDGPALRIVAQGKATRRFPLCRISRVVVSGNAGWSTNALLACADEGITVTFLTKDGCPRARWIGRVTSRGDFMQRWNDFLDRPDWMPLYKQWSASVERRAVRMCAWRMGWSPTSNTDTMSQTIVETSRVDAEESLVREFESRLYGLAHTRITEKIIKLGLPISDVVTPHLEHTLQMVIKWGLYPEYLRCLSGIVKNKKRKAPVNGAKTIVRFFEKNSGLIDFHLRDTVFRLHRFLIDFQ